jgi:hypothetical protein
VREAGGTIGCAVRTGDRPLRGQVCAVFARALHVRAGELFVTVGGPELPPHPYSLAWPGWPQLRARIGDPVEITADAVAVGGQRAPLGPLRSYLPRPAARRCGGAAEIGRALRRARARAARLPWRGGLQGWLAPGRGDPWSGAFLSAALPDVELARAAVRRGDWAALARAAEGLAGLGTGLTPSGDDLLSGLLAAVRFHTASAGHPLPQAALDEVAGRAAARTSPFSGFLLRCAARGLVSAPVERWLRTVVAGGRTVEARTEAVADAGHSSGVDTLAGLICGLEASLGASP